LRKDPLGALLVVLLLVGLGIVVWATRHPESKLLETAEGWPVAGPLIERFRARYLPQPRDTSAEDSAEPVGPQSAEQTGRRVTRLDNEVVWVNVGTPLRSDADARAPVVETVSEVARLPVLERTGDWYRVLRRDRIVWVRLPAYGEGGEPPLGSEPVAPKPLPGRPPDPEMLEMAVDLLPANTGPTQLGEYQFFTDVEDEALVEVLGGVARDVERAYAGRYGVVPIDRPREAIVLFDRERDYRSLQNRHDRLVGLPAVGLVSRGVVAVYVGTRGRQEVAATLVHELAHLLNRRALGPALPPWLDEGLADDLSYSRIDVSGELLPGELAGSTVDLGSITIWKGGRAAALELQRALMADRSVPLQDLVLLDWRAFVDPERRLHYPQSGLFVRYLIDSKSGLGRGFHAFLAGVAAGESVAPDALLAHLGRSWADLEIGFGDWALARLQDLLAEPVPTSNPAA
jgi:hypothetical protein